MVCKAFLAAATLILALSYVGEAAKGVLEVARRADSVFDCSGRPSGVYAHPDPNPEKCRNYIYCTRWSVPIEMSCPKNHLGVQLQFSHTLRNRDIPCDLPGRVCCQCDVDETTTPKADNSTTQFPDSLSPPDAVEQENSTRPCNPNECKLDGWCDCYEECVRSSNSSDSGYLQKRLCGKDLFWLPNDITGGTCVYFQNLPERVQTEYRSREDCIPKCQWFQAKNDTCSPRYTYRLPFDNQTNVGREIQLACESPPLGRQPLYWVQSRLTCDACYKAFDATGTPCNC